MGQNYFFVTVVVTLAAEQFERPWQTAFAIVFVSGMIFLLLSVVGIREASLNAISPTLRSSIAVGIGLFIAFIGLKNGKVIGSAPTLVSLEVGNLLSADAAVFWGRILRDHRVCGSSHAR